MQISHVLVFLVLGLATVSCGCNKDIYFTSGNTNGRIRGKCKDVDYTFRSLSGCKLTQISGLPVSTLLTGLPSITSKTTIDVTNPTSSTSRCIQTSVQQHKKTLAIVVGTVVGGIVVVGLAVFLAWFCCFRS